MSPGEQFMRLSQRMRRIGRTTDKPGGNNNKLIRLRTDAGAQALKAALHLAPTSINVRSLNRIPEADFDRVKPHHVWMAVEALRSQTDWAPYSPSIDYDVLLEDGVRLPPKAVFGYAASEALGFPVLPRHFSGGLGTACFETIENAGFAIAPKSGGQPATTVPAAEEEGWLEGAPKLRNHLRRERARGLSKAKKSAFMEANNGRLFCEICECEPIVAHQDPLADACIEVHHREKAVADMGKGHVTKLDDLQCLCANCHRLVHARLRQAEKAVLVSKSALPRARCGRRAARSSSRKNAAPGCLSRQSPPDPLRRLDRSALRPLFRPLTIGAPTAPTQTTLPSWITAESYDWAIKQPHLQRRLRMPYMLKQTRACRPCEPRRQFRRTRFANPWSIARRER